MAKELRSKFDLSVTAYDEMFMTEDQRAENQLPKIHKIPIAQISDFPDHPYRVLDDEDMNILKESILILVRIRFPRRMVRLLRQLVRK